MGASFVTGTGMLREGLGQGSTGVGAELPVAELQDAVKMELHRISPLLLSCCSQVLLLRALSLHSFPLVPTSAVTFLNSMEVSLAAG